LASTRPPEFSPRSSCPPAADAEDDGKQKKESPAGHEDMLKVRPRAPDAAFRQ
jgi:hypothetical protein